MYKLVEKLSDWFIIINNGVKYNIMNWEWKIISDI